MPHGAVRGGAGRSVCARTEATAGASAGRGSVVVYASAPEPPLPQSVQSPRAGAKPEAPVSGRRTPRGAVTTVSPQRPLAGSALPAAPFLPAQDGVHYFPSSGDDAGALVLPREGANHGRSLPPLDECLAATATEEGAINGVPGCNSFMVVRTTPDGNCLSHACSLGVWGVHDHDAALRRAISGTMHAAGSGGATRQRFTSALARLGIPEEDWQGEWQRELDVFAGSLRGGRGPPTRSRAFLSDVHCFVLANVLRRPLVIYGGDTAMAAGLAGVYLPLLWASEAEGGASPCSRVPTCLLFHKSHFSLLATREGEGEGAARRGGAAAAAGRGGGGRGGARGPAPLAPAVTRLPLAVCDGQGRPVVLPVRFLLPEEEARQPELLRKWMDVVPAGAAPGIPAGVPAFWLPLAKSLSRDESASHLI